VSKSAGRLYRKQSVSIHVRRKSCTNDIDGPCINPSVDSLGDVPSEDVHTSTTRSYTMVDDGW